MALGGCTHSSWIKRNTLCYLTVSQTWLLSFTLPLENSQMLCRGLDLACPLRGEAEPLGMSHQEHLDTHSLPPAMLGELVVEFCCKQTGYHSCIFATGTNLDHLHHSTLVLRAGGRLVVTDSWSLTAPGNTSSVFQAHFIKQTVTADCQKDYQVSAGMTKKSLRVGSQGLSKLC